MLIYSREHDKLQNINCNRNGALPFKKLLANIYFAYFRTFISYHIAYSFTTNGTSSFEKKYVLNHLFLHSGEHKSAHRTLYNRKGKIDTENLKDR